MRTLLLSFLTLILFNVHSNAQAPFQWQSSYGGTLDDVMGSGNVQHGQIEATSDGGFIVCALSYSNDGDVSGHHGLSSTSDCWVIKLDSLGSIEWQKSLGGTGNETGESIKETPDGGYILAVTTGSNDGDVSGYHPSINANEGDLWIVKLDQNGNIVWEHAYGGSKYDAARAVINTMDSGYVLLGKALSHDGDVTGNHDTTSADLWMLKFNSAGTLLWQKCYGSTRSEDVGSVSETSDGGFILLGNPGTADGDLAGLTLPGFGSCWVVKTDSLGNIEWTNAYGGSFLEWPREVYQTNDGGYFVGSSTTSNDGDVSGNHGSLDYWLIKLDSTGTIEWQKCYGGTGGDLLKSISPTYDGGCIMAGNSSSVDGDLTNNFGSVDGWIIQVDSVGNIEWQRSFGGSEAEDITGAIQIANGGYAFCAESFSNDHDVSGHHGPLSSSDVWIAKLGPLMTGIGENLKSFTDFSVIPNPAGSSTNLSFSLKNADQVSIEIYDSKGAIIRSLSNDFYSAGLHRVFWNLKNDSNADVENGIYIAKIRTSSHSVSSKIILMNN